MKEITINDIEKLNPSKYYIDIDGVVFHSVEAMVHLLNKKFNKNVKPQEIISWNFTCCYPNMTDKEIEWLFDTSDFFKIVKFIDGAKEFILKNKDKVVLLTKGNPKNIYEKRIFLDLNGLEDIIMVGLPIQISKGIINMEENSVFIDDNKNNLDESNATYKIMFSEYKNENICEWMKDWNGDVMYSWEEN